MRTPLNAACWSIPPSGQRRYSTSTTSSGRTKFTDFPGIRPANGLFSIARSELRHYWRDGRVERSALAQLGVPVPGLSDPEIERIEDVAGLGEVAAPLADAMASLPEEQRRAVELRVIEYALDTPAGPGQERYRLITSLLDERAYPAERVAATYASADDWWRMSVLNVAGMGRFSSDRTTSEYAKEIWGVTPVAAD